MNDLQHVSNERLEQIEIDSRGLAMNPADGVFTERQMMREAEREAKLRDDSEAGRA